MPMGSSVPKINRVIEGSPLRGRSQYGISMRYVCDTKTVNSCIVGHAVSFEPDFTGVVVCSPDTRDFSTEYLEHAYGDTLAFSIMTDQAGLFHREFNDIGLSRR